MIIRKRNSWLLDCIADICIYNQRKLFIDIVKSPIVLLGVTFVGVFQDLGTILLMLVLENR